MTKIKRKIKQFLALWLKDELLEYIQYKDVYPPLSFPMKPLDFTRVGDVIKLESVFVISDNYILEQAKRRMADEIMKHIKVDTHQLIDPDYAFVIKKRLSADEIMKHIKVDTHQLIDPDYAFARKIRLSVYVVEKY